MNELNNTSLRDSLEKLSTPELDAMLRTELEKELPDEYAVRLILKVLREREAGYPIEVDDRIEKAWVDYEEKTAQKEPPRGKTILKAAAVLLTCGLLLFTLPQEASAGSFFDRIAEWTESIFELFSPGDSGKVQKEYVFRTDNPGLQELYDTVTELGVTVPVVPMWLEDGYELVDCKVTSSPVTQKVLAHFYDGNKYATFELNVYAQNISREYHKSELDVEQYESGGIIHNVFLNRELTTAVLVRGNIECFIAVACQEDTIYQIIDSIYMMEE